MMWLRWHYRHWRARHRVWLAEQDYARWPSPERAERVQLARREVIAMEVDYWP